MKSIVDLFLKHRMVQFILNFIFPPLEIDPNQDPDVSPILQQARERILIAMLRTAFGLGAIIYAIALIGVGMPSGVFLIYTFILLFTGYIALSRKLAFQNRALYGAIMLLVLSVVELLNFGISDDSRLYFMTFTMFVLIFRGIRAGMGAVGISATSIYLIGLAVLNGDWAVPYSFFNHADLSHPELVTLVADWTFVAMFLSVSITAVFNAMQTAWTSERRALHLLQQRTEQLEASLARETQLANALQVSLDRERELSEMRSRIITTISHEFRTPLTIINNALGLLKKYSERMTPEKKERYFNHMCDSTEQLRTLIEDVETVGTGSTIMNTIVPERMPMAQFCKLLNQQMITQSQAADRVQVTLLPESENREIYADMIAVYNIMHQLVDNALKFSDGNVMLRYSTNETNLQIDVCDQGIGIPTEEQSRIFELLERGTNAETISGLGVGLYIAKQVANLMNANIYATSLGEGLGSCFTLCFPIESQKADGINHSLFIETVA